MGKQAWKSFSNYDPRVKTLQKLVILFLILTPTDFILVLYYTYYQLTWFQLSQQSRCLDLAKPFARSKKHNIAKSFKTNILNWQNKNYNLGIYMKNRDCNKWLKIAEIAKIAKINVKVQISNSIWIFTRKSAFLFPKSYQNGFGT